MLNPEQLKQFDDYGFLKGDVVLSDEEVEALRLELDMVMEGKTVKKPLLNRNLIDDSDYGMSITNKETVVQIVNIWMSSDAFLQHAGNPRICEEVAQLCRTDTLRIWHDTSKLI
jgi:phytanoyl-CoA hydroxylase